MQEFNYELDESHKIQCKIYFGQRSFVSLCYHIK